MILSFNSPIIKVAYFASRAELWIEFAEYVKPSYSCAVFVNVPVETVQRFKNAENRDEFFQQHIRKKFRYYLSLFDMCEIFRKSNWNKTADDIASYAEYKAQLEEEMRKKDLDAINALR